LQIADVIRERGRVTVAAFMDLALYHPGLGYYARAAQRSGRAGDFFTSVDVGPLFGSLLARQLAQMADLLAARDPSGPPGPFDIVEAGAGNGRLSADILQALERERPDVFRRARLHLVETSARAREAQRGTLGSHVSALASSAGALPCAFSGVLIATELLDALPAHQVVMRGGELREVYVTVDGSGAFALVEDSPSTPELDAYLHRAGAVLEDGWRAEINLAAIDWVREAARRLERGFMLLVDYGHPARELYSVTHSTGTLTTYARHRASDSSVPEWLQNPGDQDITAHVDFTSIAAAAEAGGAQVLGLLDQSYFLMGILSQGEQGAVNPGNLDLKSRLALKTLLLPGGLGSTMKMLVLGKEVGMPALAGLSYRVRIT
jgi:SAM-dependent MidA family methyltransferase